MTAAGRLNEKVCISTGDLGNSGRWSTGFIALLCLAYSAVGSAGWDRINEDSAVEPLELQDIQSYLTAAGAPAWRLQSALGEGAASIATTRGEFGGWTIVSEFVWQEDRGGNADWQLIGFELVPSRQPGESDFSPAEGDSLDLSKLGGEITTSVSAPSPPHDPNAPSGYASEGDTNTNVIHDGHWEWTITYSYGWHQDSSGNWVLGWHISAISARYTGPTDPPIIVD